MRTTTGISLPPDLKQAADRQPNLAGHEHVEEVIAGHGRRVGLQGEVGSLDPTAEIAMRGENRLRGYHRGSFHPPSRGLGRRVPRNRDAGKQGEERGGEARRGLPAPWCRPKPGRSVLRPGECPDKYIIPVEPRADCSTATG